MLSIFRKHRQRSQKGYPVMPAQVYTQPFTMTELYNKQRHVPTMVAQPASNLPAASVAYQYSTGNMGRLVTVGTQTTAVIRGQAE